MGIFDNIIDYLTEQAEMNDLTDDINNLGLYNNSNNHADNYTNNYADYDEEDITEEILSDDESITEEIDYPNNTFEDHSYGTSGDEEESDEKICCMCLTHETDYPEPGINNYNSDGKNDTCSQTCFNMIPSITSITQTMTTVWYNGSYKHCPVNISAVSGQDYAALFNEYNEYQNNDIGLTVSDDGVVY